MKWVIIKNIELIIIIVLGAILSFWLGGFIYFYQKGKFLVGIKELVACIITCIALSFLVTIPAWDCTGKLCRLEYILLAVVLDVIILLIWGVLFFKKAKKLVYNPQKKKIIEDILDA